MQDFPREYISAFSPLASILNREFFCLMENEAESRSMIKRNKVIFDELKDKATKAGFGGFHESICIGTDDYSKDWLQCASSLDYKVSSSFEIEKVSELFTISIFYYNGDKYIIISGLDGIELDNEGFEYIELNSGLFTLFTSVGLAELSSKIQVMFENFIYLGDHNEGVRYIDFQDLIQHYKPLRVFLIKKDQPVIDFDLKQLACYVALEYYREDYQQKREIHSYIFDLLKNANKNISLLRLPKCLSLSGEPYILFMELYRMLERLYSVPTVFALRDKLSIDEECPWMIFKIVEETTGWRKKEKDGLISLLNLLDDIILTKALNEILSNHHKNFDSKNYELKKSNLERLQSDNSTDEEAIKITKEELKECVVKLSADYIYMVRNSYVHYRDALDLHLTNEQINALCKAILTLLNPIYDKLFPPYR